MSDATRRKALSKRGREEGSAAFLTVTSEDPRSRYEMFLDGDLTVEDLDDDEISRGAFKNKAGTFAGTTNRRMFPREVANALRRELITRIHAKIEEQAYDAVDTIVDVMNRGEGARHGPSQEGSKRLEAARYLLERTIGKTPDKLEITEHRNKWEEAVESGGLMVDIEIDAEDIVEAEVVQEEAPAPSSRRTSARAARVRKSPPA